MNTFGMTLRKTAIERSSQPVVVNLLINPLRMTSPVRSIQAVNASQQHQRQHHSQNNVCGASMGTKLLHCGLVVAPNSILGHNYVAVLLVFRLIISHFELTFELYLFGTHGTNDCPLTDS